MLHILLQKKSVKVQKNQCAVTSKSYSAEYESNESESESEFEVFSLEYESEFMCFRT